MKPKKLPPIHPGTVLKNQFLAPHEITQAQLAAVLKFPLKELVKFAKAKGELLPIPPVGWLFTLI